MMDITIKQDSSMKSKSDTYSLGGDINVNRLGFGAMRITGPGIWGEPADHGNALAVLRHVIELGINLIDTADSYGPEVSEQLIAEALYPYPKNLVIATKGGLERPGPNEWTRNCHPDHLRLACEGSLRRLKLERIDLYQLHCIDQQVSLEDQIGILIKLQQEGKIRHIGLSNVSVAQIKAIRCMTPIVSVQNKYNLQERNAEDVLNYCTQENLAFIPWYPLATGHLTKFDAALQRMATKYKATPSQIALAWLLGKSPVMLPIPGTASIKHLEENSAAAFIKIDDATMQELDGMKN